MKIQLDWIDWAKQQVSIIRNGGYLIYPDDGAIFQLNKDKRTLELVACVPSWPNSEVESINKRVFDKIDYQCVRPKEVPTTPEAIIGKIFANLTKYAADFSTLLHGIGVIFGKSSRSIDEIIESMGKKIPINPVTIRGDGNCTVSRLWIGKDSVPDASHRFNPAEPKGPKWEKPITILLWNEGQTPSVEDPNLSAMIVDEEDFIDFVKNIKNSLSAYVRLWGQANRFDEDQKMFALFDKVEEGDRLTVELYKTDVIADSDSREKTLVGKAVLIFSKFYDGLGHLFPNGELS